MKFQVDVKEVHTHTIEVELPDNATRQQIADAANQLISEGDEGKIEYGYTLDPELWTIRKPDGNFVQ